MKKKLCLILIPFILSSFFSCTENIEEEKSLYEEVKTVVKDFIEKNEIETSFSVGVYNKDFIFNYYSGVLSLADEKKVKNTQHNLHYIYSISKTFIGCLIMDLVQQDKILLSDTVSNFFPTLLEDYNINENYINMDATIEELLTHRSGIFDYVDNTKLFTNNPFLKGSWDIFYILNYIEHVKQTSGVFLYSSSNYIILGKIVEEVLQKPLNEILREKYILPLELKNTFLIPQDNIDFSLVSCPHVYPHTTWNLTGDGKNPIDCTTVFSSLPMLKLIGKSSWAAGGIVSNVEDVSRWGYELFSKNSSIINDEIQKSIYDSIKNYNSTDIGTYGIGCRKLYLNNCDTWFIGYFGRNIGSENLMFYCPKIDVCFTILTSCNQNQKGNPNIDELLLSLYKCFIKKCI